MAKHIGPKPKLFLARKAVDYNHKINEKVVDVSEEAIDIIIKNMRLSNNPNLKLGGANKILEMYFKYMKEIGSDPKLEDFFSKKAVKDKEKEAGIKSIFSTEFTGTDI